MRCRTLLLCILLASPVAGQDDAQGHTSAELWEFHHRLQAAIAERGAAAIPDFYAKDAVIMPAEAGRLDRAAFVDMIEGMADLPGGSYQAEPSGFMVSDAGDMAYEIGTYLLSFETPDGLVEIAGDYVAILRKRDGRWWVTLQVDSPNPPPGE